MYGDAHTARAQAKNAFCDHPRNTVHFQVLVLFSQIKTHAIT